MKLTTFFIALLYSITFQAQCEINLDEFYAISELNDNELESLAIRKGFEFDHIGDGYFCTNSNLTDARDFLVRSTDRENNNITVYNFYDAKVYLEFKNKLETDGKYLFTENEEGVRTKGYQYNEKNIFLISTTLVNNDDRKNLYTAITSGKRN